MSMARIEFDATDETGDLQSNVSVEVRLESTNALVSVYSDRAGTLSLGNPFVVADGKVGFHVAGGAYKITLTAGSNVRTRRYVAAGLAAEIDQLTLALTETIKTSAYTIVLADRDNLLLANSASAIGFAVTAASVLGDGFSVPIKNIGAGDLTITPNGAETIDGAATKVLKQNDSVMLTSNGTNLRTIFAGGGGGVPDDASVTAAKFGPSVYALPLSRHVVLNEFMDLRYGAGSWTYRTGVGTGSDAGLAMTDALVALRSRYGRGKLIIPSGGLFLVTTPPSAADLSGNYIEGDGSQASQVCLNNSGTSLFQFSGAGGYTGGGVRGLGMFIEAGFGTTTTCSPIWMNGDATYQPDQTEIDDIYTTQIDPASYWYRGIHAVGTARTSPQGLRVGQWSNLQIFGCHNMGVALYNVVKLCISNLGVYVGTGTGGDVYIGGGGTSSTNTDQLRIDQINCNIINATNSTNCQINGKIGQFVTGTSFNIYDLFFDVSTAQSGTLGASGRTLQI